MKTARCLAVCALGLLFALGGCNLPRPVNRTLQPQDLTNTAAAQTLEALKTELFSGTRAAAHLETHTPQPPTPRVTSTRAVTQTRVVPCQRAGFIRDITIPDGATLTPGTEFTKVWEIRNDGSCPWDAGYTIVFANQGQALDAPVSSALSSNTVLPGQSVRIAVKMKAPQSKGDYESYWMLRSGDGRTFGLGADGGQRVWVKIRVENRYSFVDNLCLAEWENGVRSVECPMKENDAAGFALRVANPSFETGAQDDEPAMVISPRAEVDGVLVGRFAPIRVPDGAHLRTLAGCVKDAERCKVWMGISAVPEGGTEQVLTEWEEIYDEKLNPVDLDLAAMGLTNRQVSFHFYVRALGAMDQDKVFWLLPRIEP